MVPSFSLSALSQVLYVTGSNVKSTIISWKKFVSVINRNNVAKLLSDTFNNIAPLLELNSHFSMDTMTCCANSNPECVKVKAPLRVALLKNTHSEGDTILNFAQYLEQILWMMHLVFEHLQTVDELTNDTYVTSVFPIPSSWKTWECDVQESREFLPKETFTSVRQQCLIEGWKHIAWS